MTYDEMLKETGLNARQICLRLNIRPQNATLWKLKGKVPQHHIEAIRAIIEVQKAQQKSHESP